MAILKHFAVKNADYGAVIDYLKYQHDEFHLVPILDENGNSMLRDEFYFDGLNCNPEAFDKFLYFFWIVNHNICKDT